MKRLPLWFSSAILFLCAVGMVASVYSFFFTAFVVPVETQANAAIRTPVACTSSVVVSGNTATTTQLVALSSSQRVYVCGVALSAAGATTVKLTTGTGANCGTGTADLTGAMTLATGVPLTWGTGAGTLTKTPASQALCWTNSGAVQVSGVISYAQF